MRRVISVFIFSLMLIVSALASSATTYGPTVAGDTVWSIATKLQPSEKISISQVALAIFYHNKQAFYEDNINALMLGKTVKLPDMSILRSITKIQAEKEVMQQDREWERGIKKIHKRNVKIKTNADKEKVVSEQAQDLTPKVEAALSETASPLANVTVQPEVSQSANLPVANVQSQPETNSSTNLPGVNVSPQPAALPIANSPAVDISSQAAVVPQAEANALPKEQQLVVSGNYVSITGPIEDNGQVIKELNDTLNVAAASNNVVLPAVADVSNQESLVEKNTKEPGVIKKKICTLIFGNKFFALMQQYSDQLHDYLGAPLFLAALSGIILILLLLLIYLIVPRHRDAARKCHQDDMATTTEDQEEYDIMEGKESTAAKLNLARAYIEMGQEDKAKTMLQEILMHGNDADQEEAKAILDGLKNKREMSSPNVSHLES